MRTAIAGAPRAGKTTLATAIGGTVLHTDDLIGQLEWSDASARVSEWFDRDDKDLVVEGVAVPRALRKWLARNPTGKPVDQVIYMREPRVGLTPGQVRMAKACETVWSEVVPELRRRGVELQIW